MSRETKILGIILVVIVVAMVGAFMLLGGGTSTSPSTKVDAAKLTNATARTLGNGPVQVVEFGDYQCPACGAAYPGLKQLTDQDGKDITFVFRNFPLSMHPNAKPGAMAAEAAGQQDKYWEMHDKLYENQSAWVDLSDPTEVFVGYASDLGLDVDVFRKALSDQKSVDKIQNDINDGQAIGVNATPTVYINGMKYTGAFTYDALKSAVESAKSGK